MEEKSDRVDNMKRPQSVPTAATPEERAPKVARRYENDSEWLSSELQNARTDFTVLAERQISCMEMCAKSMQQIADNDRQTNEILRTLVEAQKVRDEIFSQLVVAIKDCVAALKKQ